MPIAQLVFSLFKKFAEAKEALLKRAIVSPDEAAKLDDYEKRKSFWVAGVSEAAKTQQILDSLGDAIDKGQGFQAWQKNALADDGSAIRSLTKAHRETVFRTNVQTAYSAGRDAQMSQPAVMRARPYRLIQTIDDARRSTICKGLSGTLMPANDPLWAQRQPPYHFNCRSNVRAITERQALDRGGPTGWPAVQPAPGFGGSGAAGDYSALSQSIANLDPVLADVAKRKARDGESGDT